VKVNATGDHPDEVVRRIQSEISSWTPERGPRWAELSRRVEERPLQVFKVYALAAAALAVILFGAFLAMAAFNVGTLVSQPVVSQSQIHK
jgi:hypothetical protein